MTTPSTERKAGPLLGTGSQTTWPFTFKVFAATDIAVTIANSLGVETQLVYGVDYNVTLNANQETSPGGTVTYPISGTPLPTGSRLVIVGNLPYDQPLDLPGGGNFSPLAIENQLDRMVMQIQQLREQTSRALQVSITTDADVTLPPPAASQLIGWDSTGENLENVPLDELATAIAYSSYRYDLFTGNGSTTSFALSEDPAALANLDVSISGVVQVPGTDYSLVNGNLAFASAPANGTTILARYGQALTGVPDSDDITFLQTGAGAVTRTVQNKLQRYIDVTDFGAVGDGRTDDSAAFQAAVDAAIASTGEVFVPAGEYVIDDTVVLDFAGGIKIRGTAPNSIGTRSEILQRDVNKPVFQIDSIATHLTGLSFTNYAGSKKDSNGNAITVVSATSNSITLSANPWDGSPVIWNVATPVIATDGTPYSSVIQLSVMGSWYASSVTVNGNGTVTLNNVKGANGTLNTLISGTVGNAVEKFISLAMFIDPAVLTNPNAGMIYCSVKENQFYDTLWFNQVTRAFNFSALGSGGGPGIGVGNAGFMNNIVLDQGANFIYGQGDIYGLQITNSQFFGVGIAFFTPFGGIKSSNFSNCQVVIGKMFQANNDLYGLTVTGCSFNAIDGYGYSNLLFNNAGIIDRCTIVGNNFGRSTNTVINTTAINATIISGNDIISNGELGSQPWLYVLGAGAAGYITNSYLGGNNFAAQYLSNNNRLGFLSASPSVAGSTFGGEWIGYQTGTEVTGWLAPTFQNSWANVGAGTQAVEYFKDQNGIVHIKGELAGGAAGTVAFTLPTGYRPLGQLRIYGSRANTAGGEVPMAVQIDTSGAVTIQTAVVSWGDFGMISFPTR